MISKGCRDGRDLHYDETLHKGDCLPLTILNLQVLRRHLARYKVPEQVLIVDQLPRNAMAGAVSAAR